MSISSRFSVGIHILALIEINTGVTTSEFLAKSVNTNSALIRKLMGMLKKADLIEVRPGIAGAKLAKDLSNITLYDVYKAVNVVQDKQLFHVHGDSYPECVVGRNIENTLEPILTAAQYAMEKVLKNVTLEDIIKDIKSRDNIC